MKTSRTRVLAVGLPGVALYLAPFALAAPGADPARDDERMSRMRGMEHCPAGSPAPSAPTQ